MSRRDRSHESLRRALEKDGWRITADPLVLQLEGTDLKADLGAEKTFAAEKDGRKIAIELKEFTAVSGVSELEKTMGQIQLYQWALDVQEPERILFLAVSETAYVRHFEKPLFRLAVQRNKINLLIYQLDSEAIVEWKTQDDMLKF
jgi:XisH protein